MATVFITLLTFFFIFFSSPVIEATNELYRKMAELLQWSDQVSTLHRLIEDGDKRMVNGSSSNSSNIAPTGSDGSSSPDATVASTEKAEPEDREQATQENIKMAHEVSRNLLEAFEVSVCVIECAILEKLKWTLPFYSAPTFASKRAFLNISQLIEMFCRNRNRP